MVDIDIPERSVERTEGIAKSRKQVTKGTGIKVQKSSRHSSQISSQIQENIAGKGKRYVFAEAGTQTTQTDTVCSS